MSADEQRTREIAGEQLARLRERHRRARPSQVALTLYHRDGARLVPLADGASVVLGRFPPADVVLRDDSLSRCHARVEVLDGIVWVEDLQSTNGTFLGDQRIQRAAVALGAELAFGAVSAVVHSLDPSSRVPEAHDRFIARLDQEVARAREHGRQVSLLMFRPVQPTPAARWIPRVFAAARTFDCIGLYSVDTVELLRPETSTQDAMALATALSCEGDALQVGIATFPDHATSAQGLLAAARAALLETHREASTVVALEQDRRGLRTDDGAPIHLGVQMQKLAEVARRLAQSSIPVLIVGETGTGKEVVARLVATGGRRSRIPLVTVNCGGMAESLVEGTLFGHVHGAFTGATHDRAGVFEAADGGTLFLDEVGELPPSAQAALLRVLETGRFQRVGATAETRVNVRLIAATNQDLEARVERGRFRRDLFYRLNAMTLEVPPLRERREEIPHLVERFVSEANRENGTDVRGVDDEALAALLAHHWPGNVRELKNAVERAVVIATGERISLIDLPRGIQGVDGRPCPQPADGATPAGGDLRDDLAHFEASRIRAVLEDVGWHRETAAERLGLPVRTLYRKMRQHKLDER